MHTSFFTGHKEHSNKTLNLINLGIILGYLRPDNIVGNLFNLTETRLLLGKQSPCVWENVSILRRLPRLCLLFVSSDTI